MTLNNTAPTPGAVAPLTLTCTTLSGSLTETATTTGAAAYAWAGPGVTAGAATGTATVNAAGTYTVTVTDGANGCTSTAAGVVTLNNTAPTPGAVAPLTLTCAQNTGQLSETPTAVSGTPSYSWSGPSITAGGTTASPTVGAAGNYTVTVTDGANGCTATAAGVVTLNGTPPTLAAVAPANLTCTVLSATLTETPTASIGTLSYSWTGPVGGITAGGTTASATVGAPGTYTVSVTDAANNCSTVTSVTVTQTPNNLALDTASTPANCSNLAGSATVTVTAGTPSAYTWSGAASTFTTATANNIGAGTYTVTVSDNNGCTKTAAVKVSQTPVAFSIAASQLQNFNCLFYGADTVVVTKGTVTTPVFAWSDGTSNQNDTALIPGTYTVTVTDQSTGCVQTAAVTITADTLPPHIMVSPTSETIELGKSVNLVASGGIAYGWSNGDTVSSITVAPTRDSTFWVYGIGNNFCIDSAVAVITVETPCHNYFMPNAFSPNGDSENDVLFVKCRPSCVSSFSLKIFDRWGEEVAEITDPAQGWDGSFRAKPLEPAVYMYYLKIGFNDGTKVSKTGNITLVR